LTEPRIKTEILVSAGFRYCDQNLMTAVLRRRGDPDAGALFVKVSRLDGTAMLFARQQAMEGGTIWRRASGDDWLAEADVETRLEKEIGFDPDIWIIEVEDPKGRNPFADLT
jgi:hypothetical protein